MVDKTIFSNQKFILMHMYQNGVLFLIVGDYVGSKSWF